MWCNTLIDIFSTAQNSLWTHWFRCLLVILPFLFPTSSTSAKCFPSRTSFIQENKTVIQDKIRWIGRVCHGDHAVLVKNCWTLSGRCGQVLLKITHHEMGKCVERGFRKNSLKLNTTSYNNSSWDTDTGVFLEHSPGRGSLYYKGFTPQKITAVFWLSFIYICVCVYVYICIYTYINMYIYLYIYMYICFIYEDCPEKVQPLLI